MAVVYLESSDTRKLLLLISISNFISLAVGDHKRPDVEVVRAYRGQDEVGRLGNDDPGHRIDDAVK